MYEELHIKGDIPRDLETFIGLKTNSFGSQRFSVMTVYEHNYGQGNSLVVENAATTVMWNYGPWNCYTMAALPNLAQEQMNSGYSWDDQISSVILKLVDGADAMGVGYYKDPYYATYGCGYNVHTYALGQTPSIPYAINFGQYNFIGGPFCTHMDNHISSIRIKAIWQGCPVDFDDLYLF